VKWNINPGIWPGKAAARSEVAHILLLAWLKAMQINAKLARNS
jgi:hypothetical protein